MRSGREQSVFLQQHQVAQNTTGRWCSASTGVSACLGCTIPHASPRAAMTVRLTRRSRRYCGLSAWSRPPKRGWSGGTKRSQRDFQCRISALHPSTQRGKIPQHSRGPKTERQKKVMRPIKDANTGGKTVDTIVTYSFDTPENISNEPKIPDKSRVCDATWSKQCQHCLPLMK